MNKITKVFLVLIMPLIIIASVAQSARYYTIVSNLKKLEIAQADWIEENRRLLANIAVAKSRARIDKAMEQSDGYQVVSPKNTLRIEFGN